MSWDPFQREALAELGLVVYLQADATTGQDVDVAAANVASVASASPDDRLLQQVARAAGMSREALLSCVPELGSPGGLRGDAAAKRALWPRLRALRRQRG